eukprot:SAG31_NODE_4232_length_3436_cov_1.384477_4_plen_45_part_00
MLNESIVICLYVTAAPMALSSRVVLLPCRRQQRTADARIRGTTD